MQLSFILIVAISYMLGMAHGWLEVSLFLLTLSAVKGRDWWELRARHKDRALKAQAMDHPNEVTFIWPDCCSCSSFDQHTTNYQWHGWIGLEQAYCIIKTIWIRNWKELELQEMYQYLPPQTEFEDEEAQKFFALQLERYVSFIFPNFC